MSRIVKVYPSCGFGQVHKRCRDASRLKYRCSACKTNFQIPAQKEVNRSAGALYVPKELKKYFN